MGKRANEIKEGLESRIEEALSRIQEQERKRIAGDLHDSVGQMLSLSKMNLSGIADSISADHEEQILTLNDSMRIIDEACQEVRNIRTT
jgi:signal transduction histidine kinase